MIKVTITLALFGLATCARLDHLYLPPNGGGSASGRFAGDFQGSGSANARIPILRFDANNEGDGSYRYAYESGNGIAAQEQGDAHGDGTKAQGSYSYTAPDGQKVSISYTADENGFVPQGSHIPTPPPIPEEIQRAIQQNLADEARGVVDDGQYRGGDEGQYNPGRYDQGGAFGGFRSNGNVVNNGGYRY